MIFNQSAICISFFFPFFRYTFIHTIFAFPCRLAGDEKGVLPSYETNTRSSFAPAKFLKYFSLFVYLSLVASIIYIVVRIFLRRLLCQPGLLKANG